jgi:hypothetical protein
MSLDLFQIDQTTPDLTCEQHCLVIIRKFSRLSPEVFRERLKTIADIKLADVNISDAVADGPMRVTINRILRVPNNRAPLPAGTFSSTTKIAAVVLTSCS